MSTLPRFTLSHSCFISSSFSFLLLLFPLSSATALLALCHHPKTASGSSVWQAVRGQTEGAWRPSKHSLSLSPCFSGINQMMNKRALQPKQTHRNGAGNPQLHSHYHGVVTTPGREESTSRCRIHPGPVPRSGHGRSRDAGVRKVSRGSISSYCTSSLCDHVRRKFQTQHIKRGSSIKARVTGGMRSNYYITKIMCVVS